MREEERKKRLGQEQEEAGRRGRGKREGRLCSVEELLKELSKEAETERKKERDKLCTAEAFLIVCRIEGPGGFSGRGREIVYCRIKDYFLLAPEEASRQMELLATAINRASGEEDVFCKSRDGEYTVSMERSLPELSQKKEAEEAVRREFEALGGRAEQMEMKWEER